MKHAMCARVGRLGASLLLAGGILFLVFQPSPTAGQPAGMKKPGPNDDLVKLGVKFDGAQTCSNAKCHGADAPQEGKGATTRAEFTQWSGGDKHKDAFGQLSDDKGKATAAKLSIADATTSARCTQCHALDV